MKKVLYFGTYFRQNIETNNHSYIKSGESIGECTVLLFLDVLSYHNNPNESDLIVLYSA